MPPVLGQVRPNVAASGMSAVDAALIDQFGTAIARSNALDGSEWQITVLRFKGQSFVEAGKETMVIFTLYDATRDKIFWTSKPKYWTHVFQACKYFA